MVTTRQRPKYLQQRAWDPQTATYADLSSPEWLDRVPNRFWEDPHNHQRYMQWLEKRLKIKKPEDWYRVRCKDFTENHGEQFLSHYESPGAFIRAIQAWCPRYQFLEWLFPIAPINFWQNRDNRLRYRDWLGARLGYRETRDWYALDKHTLLANGGTGLMEMFACSPQQIVQDFFPDYNWKTWKFRQARSGFWQSKKNRREYLLWLEEQLGIEKPDDWYNVRLRDFYDNYGSALMQYNGNRSFDLVLEDLYPGRKWLRWRFRQVNKGFWHSRANRLSYLKWIGKKFGFRTFEDWLKLQAKHLLDNHGYQPYFTIYKNDLSNVVRELFPDRDCRHWMFANTTDGFWSVAENRTAYIKWLGKRLGLKTNADWYSLRPRHFYENSGRNFCNKYGPISSLVIEAFPHRKFYPWLFVRVPRGFWKEAGNRNRYFDWLAKQLKIKSVDDWDRVRGHHLFETGGVSTLVQTVYHSRTSSLIADARKRYQKQKNHKKKTKSRTPARRSPIPA